MGDTALEQAQELIALLGESIKDPVVTVEGRMVTVEAKWVTTDTANTTVETDM